MGQAVSILGVEYTAIEMRKGQWSLFTKDNRAVDWQTSFGLRVEEATQVASSDDPGGQAKMVGDTQISPVEVAQLLDIRGEVSGTVIRPVRAIVVEGAENPTLVDMPPKVSVTKNGVEVELTLNEDGEYLDVNGKKYNYSLVGQIPEGTSRLAVVEDGSGFSLWAFTKEGATEVGQINFEKQREIEIGAELLPGEYRLGATEDEWRQVLEMVNDSVEYPKNSGQRINRFERADLSQTLIMNIQGKTIAIFVEKGVRIDPVVYVDQFEALLKRFLSPGFFDDEKVNTYLLMFSKVVGAETYNLGGQGTAFPDAMGLDGRTKIDGVRVAIMTETADMPEIYVAAFLGTLPEFKSYASTYRYIMRIMDMLAMIDSGCATSSECKGAVETWKRPAGTGFGDALEENGNLHPDGTMSYPVWLTPYRY
jgi:hypothetical protein